MSWFYNHIKYFRLGSYAIFRELKKRKRKIQLTVNEISKTYIPYRKSVSKKILDKLTPGTCSIVLGVSYIILVLFLLNSLVS